MNAIATFFNDFGHQMLISTQEHVILTVVAMLIATATAVPLGIILSRCRFKMVVSAVLGAVNIVQPIPSLALVAFTLALFIWLNNIIVAVHLPVIGMLPGLVALVAYALLPILRNTYTGVKQVDPTVIEVATGMGMTKRQILFSVELPLALPFIMAGIRIATVWTIGVATLVSLVGAGGLGDLVFKGLSNYRIALIFAGAAPAAALALLCDWVLGIVEKWLSPSGVQEPQSGGV